MDEQSNKGAKMGLNSVGSLWSDTGEQYVRQFPVLAEILLLPTLIMVLGYVLLGLREPLFAALGALVAFVGMVTLVYSVLPLIHAIHYDTDVDASYKATLPWFWPFIWVTILEVLAVMGGFVMLVIPGVWLMFALGLMRYVFVVEHRRGMDALRQSVEYVKGYWWAFLGRSVLVGIATVAVLSLFDIPVAVLAGRTAGSIVSLLVSIVVGPFAAIYLYRIYQNLRALKPALAGADRTNAGTGFLKASAVVGAVAFIVVMLLMLLAVAVRGFTVFRDRGRFPVPAGGTYGAPMIPAPGGGLVP